MLTNKSYIQDFPKELEWFNTAPLSFHSSLKGKIVILNFWTSCCLHSTHALSEIESLQHKYSEDPVVFIGIHSPKFTHEKENKNLLKAILRNNVSFPVVNDADLYLWEEFGIRSWPSFVVIDPKDNKLISLSGEGNKDQIDQYISSKLEEAEEFRTYPKIESARISLSSFSALLFPGKLTLDPIKQKLFISDSNHNRIVVTTLGGQYLESIGDGVKNFKDGSFETASFSNPQGLVYFNEKLYVADAGNHSIREINFEKRSVTTLAGNGVQRKDFRGGAQGVEQSLNTPWDLAIDIEKKCLYIAMAGSHQIWMHDLLTGKSHNFSGSGSEKNLNSDHLLLAAWAQPSGICFVDNTLYIADSESSAIRAINLLDHSTHGLAGGNSDNPHDLFSFGDVDGQDDEARLQHPMGVLWLPQHKKLLIADTYNHRLKALDPAAHTLSTWAGNGQAGMHDGPASEAQFWEPSGMAFWPEMNWVFISDTNNHCVRVMDLGSFEIFTLNITIPLI